MLGSKFVKLHMSILKQQVNSLSNFASFFIVMTHNSSKLIHFLPWIKGSHQSPNFETFKYHVMSFSKVKFSKWPHVIFQRTSQFSNFASLCSVMKHNSSVLFWVKCYVLCTKGTNQSGNFKNFECSCQNSQNSCCFWNNRSVFIEFCITLQCHET